MTRGKWPVGLFCNLPFWSTTEYSYCCKSLSKGFLPLSLSRTLSLSTSNEYISRKCCRKYFHKFWRAVIYPKHFTQRNQMLTSISWDQHQLVFDISLNQMATILYTFCWNKKQHIFTQHLIRKEEETVEKLANNQFFWLVISLWNLALFVTSKEWIVASPIK